METIDIHAVIHSSYIIIIFSTFAQIQKSIFKFLKNPKTKFTKKLC